MFHHYLISVNAAGFLLMLMDKKNAIKKLWRIPEAMLFAIAAAGGSAGIWLGIYVCRHKTRHIAFTLGIPLILGLQLLICYLLFR